MADAKKQPTTPPATSADNPAVDHDKNITALNTQVATAAGALETAKVAYRKASKAQKPAAKLAVDAAQADLNRAREALDAAYKAQRDDAKKASADTKKAAHPMEQQPVVEDFDPKAGTEVEIRQHAMLSVHNWQAAGYPQWSVLVFAGNPETGGRFLHYADVKPQPACSGLSDSAVVHPEATHFVFRAYRGSRTVEIGTTTV